MNGTVAEPKGRANPSKATWRALAVRPVLSRRSRSHTPAHTADCPGIPRGLLGKEGPAVARALERIGDNGPWHTEKFAVGELKGSLDLSLYGEFPLIEAYGLLRHLSLVAGKKARIGSDPGGKVFDRRLSVQRLRGP
jgi:hypothetical protein